MILKEIRGDYNERHVDSASKPDSRPLSLFTESIVSLLSRASVHQALVDLLSLMGQTFPLSAPAMYIWIQNFGTSIYSVLDPNNGGQKDTKRILRDTDKIRNYSYFNVIIGGHPPVLKNRVDISVLQTDKSSVFLSINTGAHEGIFKEWVKILAPAIAKLIDNEQLRDMAFRDNLTGLMNHRAFEKALNSECERALRYGNAFSLIMIDIDWFKNVNDRYGHQMGDIVLRSISQKIEETVRKSDLAFRYGGEEFMVIMPHTDITNAFKLADRIKEEIENMEVIPGAKITVSQGIAQYKDGLLPSDLVKKADIGLYEAKDKGKNRIEIG